MLEPIAISLTALYLRGLPRPVTPLRRRWARIVRCLRTSDGGPTDYARVLRSNGFSEESLLLEDSRLLKMAGELVRDNKVLTAVDDKYPTRWIERLKESAPPAVWIQGAIFDKPYIGIVGSRHLELPARQFAEEIGREAIRLGYSVVSGGAIGSDLAGAKGALLQGGSVLEILPHGIDKFIGIEKCGIAVGSPDEEFSAALAMERNTLIYSAAEKTIIIQARFKEGGTWNGAIEALRRKLCPLVVRDDKSKANRALIGLGAYPLITPSDLGTALEQAPAQRGLFNIG